MDYMTTPCNACPFLKTSAPGRLGPWKPFDLLFSIGNNSFPCHKTIIENGQSLDDPTLKSCAGMAIFMNNKCELSRDPNNAYAQKGLKTVSDEVKETVFKNSFEFMSHHKQD